MEKTYLYVQYIQYNTVGDYRFLRHFVIGSWFGFWIRVDQDPNLIRTDKTLWKHLIWFFGMDLDPTLELWYYYYNKTVFRNWDDCQRDEEEDDNSLHARAWCQLSHRGPHWSVLLSYAMSFRLSLSQSERFFSYNILFLSVLR